MDISLLGDFLSALTGAASSKKPCHCHPEGQGSHLYFTSRAIQDISENAIQADTSRNLHFDFSKLSAGLQELEYAKKDLHLILNALEKHPDRVRALFAHFRSGNIDGSIAIAREIGITEKHAKAAGGGFLGLILLVAVIIVATAEDAGGPGDEPPAPPPSPPPVETDEQTAKDFDAWKKLPNH